uniref:Putative exonuclease V, mitochondrial n=1 Tax=Talaromyces marneffei PM1 TaxID=1077442 RepID=A0A093UY99_TALMA
MKFLIPPASLGCWVGKHGVLRPNACGSRGSRQVVQRGGYGLVSPRYLRQQSTSGRRSVRLIEREGSPEGRPRDRERQRDREKEWTNAEGKTEAKSEPQTETALNNGNEDVTAATSAEEKSPIERFRKPPNKAFSVSDLISPAWCELQYWYTLTKHGRKRRTPAMMQGTAVHKVLEDEVHTTVPVDITTKEDGWALRIWNVIQGLRTLRTYGLTRELEVWGLVEGEIVTGIIDQLSYICPDPNLEASAAQHYADAEAARAALPEYQMSISDYFMSSGAGKPLDEMWKEPEEPAKEVDDDYGTDLDRSHQNSGESLRAYGQEYRISANASAVAAILPHA